ncbi:hypothetical protein [Streptomyces sp. NPDC051546]|uniref:hypothetical protein n=1 Tax=Streptomyces sp. NPDC051546 TaxID=3365655 RepID=UPI0037A69AF5
MSKGAQGFVVIKCRWVVERSIDWIMHVRRHARDYERLITWAAITLMARRIIQRQCRRAGQSRPRTLIGH